MSEPRRDPRDTKDRAIKRLIDDHRKTSRGECSPDQVKRFEKQVERMLPQIYEGNK